ncbi:MAG: DnaJ domain-containing protein [Planctomycetes bacterium]|nr:DnaJ domain-containing protein [Planctomycetota bacterium]
MQPDPFQILGLSPRFDLDESAIRRAYLARVSAIHPDLAGAETAQPNGQDASAELNHAREILTNPETRATALLAVLGGPTKEADKSLPPGFLMDIMETREAIEASLAGDQSERARWLAWGIAQRQAFTAQVRAQFAAAAHSPDSLRQIRTTLNAWRYIERLIEQLDPAYDPGKADFRA